MKRCSYCGKEYPDEAVACAIDGEPLTSSGLVPDSVSESPAAPSVPSVTQYTPAPPQPRSWTDRQVRIFELLLVCVIAFGSSILGSILFLAGLTPSRSGPDATRAISIVTEAGALALVWYVLMRRGKSFRDLGFSWAVKDVGISLVLWIGAYMAYCVTYYAAYFIGFAPSTLKSSTAMDQAIFGTVPVVTLLFQFVNPFYEELIVRAYVMTEVKTLTGNLAKAVLFSVTIQTSYHLYLGLPRAIADGAIFLVFSIYYAKTNRITPVILAHLYADVWATVWYLNRHG